MSQEEVIKVLEENECLSLNEIIEKLLGKSNFRAICKALKQLEKYNEVSSIELNVHAARKFYGKNVKRKMKLYFIDEK